MSDAKKNFININGEIIEDFLCAEEDSHGLMCPEDKLKLASIEEGANKYTHPTYTARTGVPTADATLKHGGTFTVTQPVSNGTGHITAMNTRTYTLPSETSLGKGTDNTTTATITPNKTATFKAVTDTVVSGHTITDTTTTYTLDLSKFALSSEVSSAMVFKGTLGTNGTIASLPTASNSTVGDTYKVITAGTYASTAAKVGDVFTCNSDPAWVLIPSGDEPSGTVTSVATGVGLTGGTITSSGTIKAKLRSETALTVDSAAATTTSGRVYPVAVDKTGYLAVNVPWTDNNTVYTHPTYTAKSSGLYKITVDGTGHISAATAVTKTDITGLGIPAQDTTYTHPTYTVGATTSTVSPGHGKTFTAVDSVTTNNLGHVTSINTKTITLPSDSNTHYTSKNIVNNADNSTADTTTVLTNGNVWLNHIENGSVTSNHKISGSGATTVTTDTSGNIIISSTDTNTNTDTKVTAVGNHYTPAADSNAALSVDASSTTAATWNSTSLVTGVNIQRDAKGHVTGVTVDSIKMPANPNSNTAHGHSAGVGLTGSGDAGTSGTYTYKAKLRSETALTVDSAAATTTSGRVYPVAVDKTGYLAVNVPWTDNDTKYTHPTYTAKSSGLYKITVDGTGHVSGATTVVKADITGLGIPAQDTVYTHPTTSGNKHIPSGGSSGQILRWSADGTAAWGADNNTTYSAGTGISLSGTTFSNSGVRSIATGTANGTISVNTNGTSANVAVKGLGSAAYTASTAYATAGHGHTNYVDLTSTQTVSGVKTFTNGIKIGAGTVTWDADAAAFVFSFV